MFYSEYVLSPIAHKRETIGVVLQTENRNVLVSFFISFFQLYSTSPETMNKAKTKRNKAIRLNMRRKMNPALQRHSATLTGLAAFFCASVSLLMA